MDEVKLTQYSHGAGCGCKIAPSVLNKILLTNTISTQQYPSLLVGNDTRDDAAVMLLENGECIISTTDFFMPIVDDAFDFGRIASANSISDVYAMGGTPIMAIAILGWPVNQLAPEIASRVIEGSRSICAQAGIPLAGGHSIDCPEPVFGLAVTGKVNIKNLKKNSGSILGNKLYLTKPLGVGILSTAQKKNILESEHTFVARDYMVLLNTLGEKLGKLDYVTALTDVTGFGLLGHLCEMCEGANLSAEIDFKKIPIIPEALHYLNQGAFPGGSNRNWNSYGHKISKISECQQQILTDPQTNGGLLIAINDSEELQFKSFLESQGFNLEYFGTMIEKREKTIFVI